jgi:hypothetical protein
MAAVLTPGMILSQAWAQKTQKPFGPTYEPAPAAITTTEAGSTYVPMDSWMYPALDRLHSLGYLDSAFMGLRPWTRLSIAHMLERSADAIENSNDEQAKEIYLAVLDEVQPDIDNANNLTHPTAELDSVYTEFRGIDGTPLRDSFHLGQTIVNDYGRPYESGFNDYTGFSGRAEAGRFSLYFRGEYQHAPSAAGYSTALAGYLSNMVDGIPMASNPVQDTLPEGPIAAADDFRVMEATLSYHLMGHEISFGKSDHWMGPDKGASMLYSDNAEGIYGFQIDRVEPLRIPLLSRLTGPFRYDFFVGSLKGHTDPNSPWVHVEKVSFKPTRNLEFGFSRMVIWGGKGHEPITLHTFLKSFFSFQNVSQSEKFSRNDPGARFGNFDFDYRLPFMRHWVTLYADSLVHDDVSPIDAPRRAAVHPGIYLARFPGMQRLSMRVEGAMTDTGPVGSREDLGRFYYWESVQRQGTTNKGNLVGDWIGRDAKGGQAWLTYHLSPDQDIQFMYRRAKLSNQFIRGGGTQDDYRASVRKRIGKDVELLGSVQYEGYKIPILTYPVYTNSQHSDTTVDFRITWFPHQKQQP